MANETKAAETAPELDDVALAIYSQRAATGRGGDAAAVASFRDAESFLSVRKRIKAGELSAKKPTGPALADCCCPNKPHTHPLNLVSQQYGDLAKVNRVHKWLESNPTPDKDSEDFVARFRRAFPELNWSEASHGETLAVFNTARAIFPAYCSN